MRYGFSFALCQDFHINTLLTISVLTRTFSTGSLGPSRVVAPFVDKLSEKVRVVVFDIRAV